jgi:two-component system alkaline phosphatase synthesis response regulator PhoP
MAGERLLLVEDEPGIALTLEDRLVAEGYRVTVRHDGIRGEEEARSGAYDLLILDLMLPDRDGLTVCRNLRRAQANLPVLMLTARGTNLDVVVGLQQGADDYLTKPFDMGVLLARIEALLRRTRPASGATGAVREFGEYCLDEVRGELIKGGTAQTLNAQEYRLLCYLAAHPNRVLERDEILDQVWGYESGTTTRTVDVHVAKLRHRLAESDHPRHILTVRGRGYQFKP